MTSTFGCSAWCASPTGGLAPVHDTAPGSAAGGYAVAFFNPASNRGLSSRLRLVNRSDSPAAVSITGIDDDGQPGKSAVTLRLPARAACTLGAPVLESGAWGDTGPAAGCEALTGALGDGAGKWRLVVTSDQPLSAMSLLGSAAGHLTNLSSVPAGAEAGVHRLALLPPADDPLRQGFVRLVNRSDEAGTVTLRAFDDAGTAYPAQTLPLGAGQAMHFTAADLEEGHADKGLSGTGDGAGSWRLVLEPEPEDLDLQAHSLVRNPDSSSVAALHDTAPGSAEAGYEVAFSNPASNRGLSSRLRLVNRSGAPAAVAIAGTDSAGQPGEERGDVAYPRSGRVHPGRPGAGVGRVGGHRTGSGLRSAHRRARRRRGQVAPSGNRRPAPRGDEPAAPCRLRQPRQPLHRARVRPQPKPSRVQGVQADSHGTLSLQCSIRGRRGRSGCASPVVPAARCLLGRRADDPVSALWTTQMAIHSLASDQPSLARSPRWSHTRNTSIRSSITR